MLAFGVTKAPPIKGRGKFIPDRQFFYLQNGQFCVGGEFSQPLNKVDLSLNPSSIV